MLLTPEDKLILASVKIQPDAIELEQINKLIPPIQDWETLAKNCIDRGIGPLLYKKLPLLSNQSLIPESVQTTLQQAYYKTVSRSMVLYDAFRKVAEAFTANGISVIVLKGVYLCEWLYKDIGLRQFSDIDLLVKKEEGEKCLAILAGMGFKPFDSNVTEFIGGQTEIVHHTPMVLNEVSVEIHIRLHRKSKNYAIEVNDFIQHAVPVTINAVPVKSLNLNELVIHLCVHLDKHFSGGHVQFTCFNDITNILSIHADEIDWEVFADACRTHACEELVFNYLILVNKYFNAPIPETVVTKYSYLLKESDEELFVKYLHGFIPTTYHVSTHWQNIRQIKGFSSKAHYLSDLIFPPKKFMIQKYGLVTRKQSVGGSNESVVPIIRNVGSSMGSQQQAVSSRKLVVDSEQQTVSSKQSAKGSGNSKLRTKNGVFRHPVKRDYKLKFWWLWYPYRWWVGVKGVISLVRRK